MPIKEVTLPSADDLQATEYRHEHIRFQFYRYESGPRPKLSAGDTSWTPAVDCYTTPDDVFLEVDLAGIESSDIEIHFGRDAVRIAGVRRETPGSQNRGYHVMEIDRGKFSRTVQLPTAVDCRRAEHSFRNGLLILRVPRVFNSPFSGCDPAGSVKDFDES